jgi:hypothetical protein
MPFTTVQFIFIYAAFVLGAVFGWFLWHHKDADFFNAFSGSLTFFGCIFCGIVFLLCHLTYNL